MIEGTRVSWNWIGDPLIAGQESPWKAYKSTSPGSGMIGVVWVASMTPKGISELFPKFLAQMVTFRLV